MVELIIRGEEKAVANIIKENSLRIKKGLVGFSPLTQPKAEEGKPEVQKEETMPADTKEVSPTADEKKPKGRPKKTTK